MDRWLSSYPIHGYKRTLCIFCPVGQRESSTKGVIPYSFHPDGPEHMLHGPHRTPQVRSSSQDSRLAPGKPSLFKWLPAGSVPTVYFAVHPSAASVFVRLFMYASKHSWIHLEVCEVTNECGAVECEEPYLLFSAYKDFYSLHIALRAAETEALQGHRDAQLFIVPFNKTWI